MQLIQAAPTMLSTTQLLLILSLALTRPCQAQRGSDPTQFNDGSILAMAGRNSVAIDIDIDARFSLGMQTISTRYDHHHAEDDTIIGNSNNGRATENALPLMSNEFEFEVNV